MMFHNLQISKLYIHDKKLVRSEVIDRKLTFNSKLSKFTNLTNLKKVYHDVSITCLGSSELNSFRSFFWWKCATSLCQP
jgi:hypothetical protein